MILPDPSPLVIPSRERLTRDGVMRVETTTLLPGGAVATLTLRWAGETFSVEDGGIGRMTLMAIGMQDLTSGDIRRGTETAERLGVTFDEGGFRLHGVSLDRLPAAISYVAEACRSWTTATAEVRQRARERGMASQAVERLRKMFPDRAIDPDRELAGASNKLHRFDAVVTLSHTRFAVFETVLPVAGSIAAAHLKFYDVKQAHPHWPREAVVEDLSEWASEDLTVMQQVASGIRGLRAAWDDLGGIAA